MPLSRAIRRTAAGFFLYAALTSVGSVVGRPEASGAAPISGVPAANSPAVFETGHEVIPNFARRPTRTSRQSGAWSDPGTWREDRIPGTDDVVLIAEGHVVTYDRISDAPLAAVGVAGTLRFRTDVSTRLIAGTVLVHPEGSLEIGRAADPVRPDVTAEVVFANRPLYTTSADPATGVTDPQQHGTGVIVLGSIDVHGAPKNPTWVRLATEPLAGQITLELREPVRGWRQGDSVVIPDTRHLRIEHPDHLDLVPDTQTEVGTIASVSADGRRLTLTTPLRYDHRGARNPDGSRAMSPSGEPLLPHAANLDRNVRFRSIDPDGTRGHAMFTHQARVRIHHAAWVDMGRTTTADLDSTEVGAGGGVATIGRNQVGRYWTHFHHLSGPPRPGMVQHVPPDRIRQWLEENGWQYEFVGNSVRASSGRAHGFKWGIAIHESHFGTVTNNVIYNVAGAGVQTENGNESYNLIARNFAVRIPGLGRIRVPVPAADLDKTSNLGRDGSGFWFRGGHNWIEGNVAADVRFTGHYVTRYYLRIARGIPRYPGAGPPDTFELRLVPVLSFADQEAYGPMEQGLYGAAVSGWLESSNWPEVRIERFVAWHPYFQQIEWYRNGRTTFTDLVLRADPAVTSRPALSGTDMRTVGMRLPYYENVDLTIRRADIRGFPKGLDLPTRTLGGRTLLVDSVLENYVNVALLTKISDTRTEIRDVLFQPFGAGPRRLTWGYNNRTLRSYPRQLDIALDREDRKVTKDASYLVHVINFNGRPGDDFRVYDSRDPAPCAATRPAIDGITCAAR